VDIAAWLRELGLERYEQAFQENEVGLDILPELTAEDLKEIGVIPVGDRRRLLKAIADFRRSGGSEAEPAPGQIDLSAGVDEAAKWPSQTERRPLTVMFCDLADSTALSTKLDPEDAPRHRPAARMRQLPQPRPGGPKGWARAGKTPRRPIRYPKAHPRQSREPLTTPVMRTYR
jgi:SAM domain (Sterile alpha motif)